MRFLCAAFLMCLLSACSPVGMVMGAGAAFGTAATEERGVDGALQDTRIAADINKKFLDEGIDFFRRVDVTVYNGRVLLTGYTPSMQMRLAAIRYAWQAEGVKEVINEINIAESADIADSAKDARISAEVKTKLTFAQDIYAVNYKVTTVDGTVYLIGLARSREEAARAVRQAKRVAGVKRIISHVKVKGEQSAPAVEGNAS